MEIFLSFQKERDGDDEKSNYRMEHQATSQGLHPDFTNVS